MKSTIYRIALFAFLALGMSCNNFLEEEVFTEFDADDFVATEEGIEAILISAYGRSNPVIRERFHTFAAYPCDDEVEAGGGYRGRVVPFEEYTVDAGNADLTATWNQIYEAIRNCNALLDHIDNVTTLPADKVAAFKAEATFLRAWNYSELYDLWGPVPLVTTTLDLGFEYPRASDDEIKSFIESEYRSAITSLPVTQDAKGKATKGAAQAMLGRFLMNTRQWQAAADILQDVISSNTYSLLPDVTTMFSHENEGNSEMIFVFENNAVLSNNSIMAHNFPPGYQTAFRNWGAQLQMQRDFVATYHPDDQRALPWDPRGEFGPVSFGWICYEYIDKGGNYIDLINGPNAGNRFHPRSFKYTPTEDPTQVSGNGGNWPNDTCYMRYADVLLLRSEALAMIAGSPTQEAVDLLNEIRTRAGVPTYTLADFPDLDSFVDAMLDERGWEFVTEGHRRRDLIRQNRLISDAQARGKSNAQPHHVLFPIPLSEIDSNPLVEQNPGY
ncbi:RagB/SusD family nutrient uptake outer membrane protein [Seonamhaeicola marinus]|uniref:RagB/SusD family nutrient uptake outer membrane protein n=1 Tax=Seonamhaeicola marinus TaxID=1912246 RepID=A0A5D0HX16_9FLAO|nr:RagB/SusD family nutrient uptake outer membrane protein [Seonamhaeicola marinus]TYA73992.1 RagB/SusD family nutrient uptake outer membrane protein [Seonamhaeicola marinus]